jgi:hypothetical protein
MRKLGHALTKQWDRNSDRVFVHIVWDDFSLLLPCLPLKLLVIKLRFIFPWACDCLWVPTLADKRLDLVLGLLQVPQITLVSGAFGTQRLRR